MDPIELKMNRLNTKAFIDAKPVQLVLQRADDQRTASGGRTKGQFKDVPEQTFRIIEQGAPSAPQIINLTDGTAREVNFWLLGMHDADMQKGDSWRENGRDWIVGDIIRDNGYETRGLVTENGG
jgi:hypothetical protein